MGLMFTWSFSGSDFPYRPRLQANDLPAAFRLPLSGILKNRSQVIIEARRQRLTSLSDLRHDGIYGH
jgi:hypothetical protein